MAARKWAAFVLVNKFRYTDNLQKKSIFVEVFIILILFKMGSYSHITVADYPILEFKNSYYGEVVDLIFLPNDFIEEERTYCSRNKLIWGDSYINDNDNYLFKGFRQKVGICKKRLEIYGFSLKKAKKDFRLAKKIANEDGEYDFPIQKIKYEQYLEELNIILNTKEINYNQERTNLHESLITDGLGIYGQSLNGLLYSIFNELSDDEIIEYDLSDVIEYGWIKEKDVKQINTEKIIILTEGKTDKEFISNAFLKLYPALCPYYHFIDFNEYRIESNASALAKLIRNLSASNIKHHIIGIFDNDAVGIMEMKTLKLIKLPDNLRVIKYPDIKIAKKYPTIGPTGLKKMNINGLACGIEMYLGLDCLKKNNQLIPVIWKAYIDNRYQGELLEKSFIQDKFRKKLLSPDLSNYDELDLIFNEIFDAYK